MYNIRNESVHWKVELFLPYHINDLPLVCIIHSLLWLTKVDSMYRYAHNMWQLVPFHIKESHSQYKTRIYTATTTSLSQSSNCQNKTSILWQLYLSQISECHYKITHISESVNTRLLSCTTHLWMSIRD